MNDLEHDLRELLGAKARDASVSAEPTRTVVQRARRRQLGTVILTTLAAALLVVGSLVGMRSILRADPDNQRPAIPPVLPEAPEGFRSAALPYLSLAYPEHWSLVALQPDRTRDRVLQLANFDFGPGFGACEQGWSLPPGGVLLEVRLGALQGPLPPGPTSLGVVLEGTGPCGADSVLAASWEANGTAYSASGLLTADAAQADVELMERAFETMTVPENVPQTENLLGISNLVLDSVDSPVGPVVLYAYLEDVVRERVSYWIGIAGPAGSHLAGASLIGRDPPIADESVTMNLDTWGGVVWGDVAGAAVRAELRTVEGRTFPAKLLPLPASSDLSEHQVVWGTIEGQTADRVTTLLYDGRGNALNTYFPAGSRVTLATGSDPMGGLWALYLDPTSEGTGLGFRFTDHGGGGGCCLRPLKEDFRLDGWGEGSDEPSNITALASQAVRRIVFVAATGERIEGGLYPVPDASLGIPQVGLVIVPSDVTLEGQLVAYGAGDDELAREDVGDNPEPAGPTTEIDIVWDRLRRARTTVQEYAAQHHGSLSGLDALEATKIDPGIGADPGIRWNEGQLADGEVSVRGAEPAGGTAGTGLSGWTAVIVSATVAGDGSPGSIYCIAINIDENGGGNFRYGTQDAATYEECRGGWPELGP